MPLTPWQATVDQHLCPTLLDTHRQVWLSFLWGHGSFLLGPGAHKVLFALFFDVSALATLPCLEQSRLLWLAPASGPLHFLFPLPRSFSPLMLVHRPMQEMQETQVRSLSQEDPLEQEVATYSSIIQY